MSEANPLAQPTPSAVPTVSKTPQPLTIAGLQVDIYGLAELPESALSISCLWLHHPRLRAKEDMADIAHQVLSTYHSSSPSPRRGLVAVAFDQRNHGSRRVDARANESWRKGNRTHAQDMFGTVSGTVVDNVHLLDALEGYLFGAGHGPAALRDGSVGEGQGRGRRRIDQNIVLGVSLGGHSTWQLLFADPRVTAGVAVLGCPDYMRLIKDRARLSKLETFSQADDGASFLGSRDFPDALVAACGKYDPKGILFRTGDVPSLPISDVEQTRLRPLLDARVPGKRLQVLSGDADKLVPYAAGAPFLDFFKDAADTWYKDSGVSVEDIVYPGVAHTFTADMRKDAVRFILDTVASADDASKASPSKI
ncbi:hypothetical protein F5B20DRAFT_67394 [Whalleya microplaca]|nr:hypothetical protein F5B20DRAFT_67394 [Whalleya microplaca]